MFGAAAKSQDLGLAPHTGAAQSQPPSLKAALPQSGPPSKRPSLKEALPQRGPPSKRPSLKAALPQRGPPSKRPSPPDFSAAGASGVGPGLASLSKPRNRPVPLTFVDIPRIPLRPSLAEAAASTSPTAPTRRIPDRAPLRGTECAHQRGVERGAQRRDWIGQVVMARTRREPSQRACGTRPCSHLGAGLSQLGPGPGGAAGPQARQIRRRRRPAGAGRTGGRQRRPADGDTERSKSL